jgi:hypothetical protein
MFNRCFILLISLTALIGCARLNKKLALNENKQKDSSVSRSLDLPPHYFLPESVNNTPSYEDIN